MKKMVTVNLEESTKARLEDLKKYVGAPSIQALLEGIILQLIDEMDRESKEEVCGPQLVSSS